MNENRLLLDTCVVVKHFRNTGGVTEKLIAFEELCLPLQALGELYDGAYRSAQPEKNLAKIEQLLEVVEVLSPDEETSRLYGQIAAALAAAGTPIPQNDLWIAAMALQAGLPLATCDGHFDRIKGLTVLRW